MKKTKLYTYLGTNGTLTTPIHLEGIYSIEEIVLTAELNKALTNDGGNTLVSSVKVLKNEVNDWVEIDIPGQN